MTSKLNDLVKQVKAAVLQSGKTDISIWQMSCDRYDIDLRGLVRGKREELISDEDAGWPYAAQLEEANEEVYLIVGDFGRIGDFAVEELPEQLAEEGLSEEEIESYLEDVLKVCRQA